MAGGAAQGRARRCSAASERRGCAGARQGHGRQTHCDIWEPQRLQRGRDLQTSTQGLIYHCVWLISLGALQAKRNDQPDLAAWGFGRLFSGVWGGLQQGARTSVAPAMPGAAAWAGSMALKAACCRCACATPKSLFSVWTYISGRCTFCACLPEIPWR